MSARRLMWDDFSSGELKPGTVIVLPGNEFFLKVVHEYDQGIWVNLKTGVQSHFSKICPEHGMTAWVYKNVQEWSGAGITQSTSGKAVEAP